MYEMEMFMFVLWLLSFLLILEKKLYFNVVGVIFSVLIVQYLFMNSTILNIPEFLMFGFAVSGLGVAYIFDKVLR